MKRKTKCIGATVLSFAMVMSMLPGSMSKAESTNGYTYIQDYTLGWTSQIAVYEGGTASKTVEEAGIPVYNRQDDNPFGPQTEQAWNEPDLKLSQPVQFTTSDGKVHDVESMLTNFNFIADPTAIDNSDVDGKLYVYGTTEGFSYENGVMIGNKYANHSLTILSTSDMVNWTDEGFMDSANLTNEPSYSDNIVKGGFTSGQSWAPSGLKIDGDGDGDDEYYIFYTNGGAVGYVMGESPTGPWRDPLGKALFTKSSPNCSGVVWCFDPAVLVDDKGDAYVYFGGGTVDGNPGQGKTGRVCKIGFEEGTGEVYMDGEPQVLDTYYFFEDSEINQFNGKYYYSYCTNWGAGQTLSGGGSIAAYVSSDPMDITYAPGENGTNPFTKDGVYHHFLGTILDNPSVIYGQTYNNHHHMQSFKGHNYIFYHSTVLNNSIHRASNQYRNLHVDEIDINAETDDITIEPSYEGAKQIENFNPYKNFDGSEKIINATTTSYSAGVKSTRDDEMVEYTQNGSPMVLDCIDTGDWTKIQGVDLGSGVKEIAAEIKSDTNEGAIEVFIDDPTSASNKIASIPVNVKDAYDMVSVPVESDVTGVHDVYFVFRGSDYTVASWKFTENKTDKPDTPDVPVATNPPANTAAPSNQPTVTPSVDTAKTYKAGKADYKITDVSAATVQVVSVDKKAASVVIPASVTIEGKAYAVTDIAAGAFKNCKKLKSVTIGKNVKSIGAKAFYKCSSLKKITIKSTSLKKVGKAAFKGINAKAKIKVPAKKLKAYKKVLKGKGQKKSVKIIK